MRTVESMGGLLTYIQSLSLSAKNMHWLGNKLIEMADKKTVKELAYPKISSNWRVSKQTMSLAIGPLAKDMDWDKETDKMWEEMAR